MLYVEGSLFWTNPGIFISWHRCRRSCAAHLSSPNVQTQGKGAHGAAVSKASSALQSKTGTVIGNQTDRLFTSNLRLCEQVFTDSFTDCAKGQCNNKNRTKQEESPAPVWWVGMSVDRRQSGVQLKVCSVCLGCVIHFFIVGCNPGVGVSQSLLSSSSYKRSFFIEVCPFLLYDQLSPACLDILGKRNASL